jgi:hypothetical protein
MVYRCRTITSGATAGAGKQEEVFANTEERSQEMATFEWHFNWSGKENASSLVGRMTKLRRESIRAINFKQESFGYAINHFQNTSRFLSYSDDFVSSVLLVDLFHSLVAPNTHL